jgi:hypothetical protein
MTGGIDPVSTTDRGDIEAMSQAWLQWARKNGFRS